LEVGNEMAAETKGGFVEKLQHVDRRILYLVLAVLVAIPLIWPFTLPLQVSPAVYSLYDHVESLKSGDVVLMSFDYSAGGAPDIHPQVEAIVRHLAKKDGVGLVTVGFFPDGPMFAEKVFWILEEAGKTYGEDFVNLGYRAGGEGAIAMLASDVKAAFQTDFRGNDTSSLPLLQKVKSARDFSLIIEFAGGSPGPPEWIRQVQAVYRVPLAVGISTSMVPANMPFLESGQLISILSGLRGAAEYEVLLGEAGKGSAAMSSQTLGHLVIMVFLIVGNVSYFLTRKNSSRRIS